MANVTSLQGYRDKKADKKSESWELLHQFDFQGHFQARAKNMPPQELESVLKSPVRVIDLAYGAVIATRVTRDKEAADWLATTFVKNKGQSAVLLGSIPDYARGYVWND